MKGDNNNNDDDDDTSKKTRAVFHSAGVTTTKGFRWIISLSYELAETGGTCCSCSWR